MNDNLAEAYVKYLDDGMPNGSTWNDFFDYTHVPMESRTNFSVAAILKQAQSIVDCAYQ